MSRDKDFEKTVSHGLDWATKSWFTSTNPRVDRSIYAILDLGVGIQ